MRYSKQTCISHKELKNFKVIKSKEKTGTHYNVTEGAELADEVLDCGIFFQVTNKECACGFGMELVKVILIGPDVCILHLCEYNNTPVTMEHYR